MLIYGSINMGRRLNGSNLNGSSVIRNMLIRSDTWVVLSSNYPKEIKGISEIIRKGNEIEIKTDTPTRGHKKSRYVRVSESFNETQLKDLVKFLKTYSEKYIRDLIKNVTGTNIRTLRKQLANDQLIRTRSVNQVSRSLGHNASKNSAYYLNWINVSDQIGIDDTIKILNKTEYGQLFSLMRLAIRTELLILKEL